MFRDLLRDQSAFPASFRDWWLLKSILRRSLIHCLTCLVLLSLPVSAARAGPGTQTPDSPSLLPAAETVADGRLDATPSLFHRQGWQESSAWVVGLNLDLTRSRGVEESILRGVELAIEEINAGGGVLGRPLRVEVMDHQADPQLALRNIQYLAEIPNLIAAMGGVHSPVILHGLRAIHAARIPLLVPWAAANEIVANGFDPNYVFRLSLSDRFVLPSLMQQARAEGIRKVGLLVERTSWGRSNYNLVMSPEAPLPVRVTAIEWFPWGAQDFAPQLAALRKSGAEAVLLIANAPEGTAVLRELALSREGPMPLFSHWGILDRDLRNLGPDILGRLDIVVPQSFSFVQKAPSSRADELWRRYAAAYPDSEDPQNCVAPSGVAHAYDLIHLLALAVREAGTTDRASIRDAMERLPAYQGVVDHYAPAFTPNRHEALSARAVHLMQVDLNGRLKPLEPQAGMVPAGLRASSPEQDLPPG